MSGASGGPGDRLTRDFERIEPSPIAADATGEGRRRASTRSRAPSLPAAIVTAGLLSALALVFLWLPGKIDRPVEGTGADAVERGKAETAEVDLERELARRDEAQRLAAETQERRAKLDVRAIGRWNGEGEEALSRRARDAEEEVAERDYASAAVAYREAIEIADRLLAESQSVLADALERGRKALDEGNAAAARDAFSLALAIEPGNAGAVKGNRRAETLDEVRALLGSGRQEEQAGRLDAALEDYRRALALDGESEGAREALARVEAARAERDYRRHMSRGLAALGRADHAAARRAFREAQALRPGAPEVLDGLARAEAGLQESAAAALRGRALALEADERWPAALSTYEEALAIDGSLGFARSGRERAKARAALAEGLEFHIAHPYRLIATEVQQAVEGLLAEARAVGEPGPILRGQIERLAGLLATARTPIVVELRSDERTDVLLYRVGRLGRFASKRLQLTPGSYTAVGRREGYRDVRREFRVAPGESTIPPIDIRCEEKI